MKEAETKANLKINEPKNAKTRIKRARTFYESKLQINESSTPFIKEYKERKILHSSLTSPTIDNLYNYHHHFFNELPDNIKNYFSFKDLAGIYEENKQKQMFAKCISYKDTPLLKTS